MMDMGREKYRREVKERQTEKKKEKGSKTVEESDIIHGISSGESRPGLVGQAH